MRVRITEALIRQIPLSSRTVFIRDRSAVGFALRVTPAGARSFIAESRVAGRMRQSTIGAASRFTADEARTAARALLAEMAQGKDPQAKRRAARARSDTLGAMLRITIAAKDIRASTAGRYRAQLRRDLFDWLDKPIADITPQMVRLRYEALLKRSASKPMARCAFCAPSARGRSPSCGAAGRVADDARHADGRPCARLETACPQDDKARPEDLPAWWRGVDSVESEELRAGAAGPACDGPPRQRASRLAWADVDLPRRRLAIAELQDRRFSRNSSARSSRDGSPAGAATPSPTPCSNVRDPRAALQRRSGIGSKRVAPHDLRRTFLTFGEQCGAPNCLPQRSG